MGGLRTNPEEGQARSDLEGYLIAGAIARAIQGPKLANAIGAGNVFKFRVVNQAAEIA